jgi:predicted RNA-binding protein with PUA-like domain
MVDVQLERKFRQVITLATLREHENRALKGLALLKRGNRLSVTPVSAAHWKFILDLAS